MLSSPSGMITVTPTLSARLVERALRLGTGGGVCRWEGGGGVYEGVVNSEEEEFLLPDIDRF